MSDFTVVIPSKDVCNLASCLDAIWRNEPNLHRSSVVVIDDGLAYRPEGPTYLDGVKPFVFARNVNAGIRAAGDSDVITLNDDALLTEYHGFTKLHMIVERNPEYGIVASSCNNVGNERQLRRGMVGHLNIVWDGVGIGYELRDEPRMVCLIAVWLRRAMLNQIGLLDERYVGYGIDDDDLCFTARAAGWKIGIYDGCYVDHGSLRSSYRGDPTAPSDFRPNLRLFMEKWGHDNRGIPNEQSPWRHLLDEVRA